MVKKDDKAKLEEEEVRFSLHYGELRGGGRVLRVVLIDAMVVGRGGSVYRHCPRAHQLAFSPPLCCAASRALERHSPPRAPTIHPRRAIAGLKLAAWSSTISPLRPAVARMPGEGSVECGRPRSKEGWSRARRRIWWCSRTPVTLYVEVAHPTHIATRSRIGADGVGVESGAHLPPGPCAPMGATTIAAASCRCPVSSAGDGGAEHGPGFQSSQSMTG